MARVWDARDSRPVTPPLPHGDDVVHAAFDADGKRVVTSCYDGTARVWDASTGQMLTRPLTHRGIVFRAAFAPDGQTIATASHDGTARLWDAVNGHPLSPPLGHSGPVNLVMFQPGSRTIATTDWSGMIRFWDLSPDPRQDQDWIALAELLTAHRLDRQRTQIPISVERQQELLKQFQRDFPTEF
jgi:WD40 repeat protein